MMTTSQQLRPNRSRPIVTLAIAVWMSGGAADAAVTVSDFGAMAPALGPYDIGYTGAPPNEFSLDGGDTSGQTFELPVGGFVQKVYFAYRSFGNGDSDGLIDFTFRLDVDNDGSFEIDQSFTGVDRNNFETSTTTSWIEFDLSAENIALAGSTPHAIWWNSDQPAGQWVAAPKYDLADVYADGSILGLPPSGDMLFVVKVAVDIPVAHSPSPADGANDVPVPTDLGWSAPTLYAPTSYDVYFGTNSSAYANPQSTVTMNQYDPPGNLAYATTYHWVVDSLEGTTNHPGTPWTFTTERDPSTLYDPLDDLENYNVVWNSPSANSAGSMPIGNGDLGMNVWAEPNGDLLLLLSKTDAWGDNGRLLKLGRVRISINPNPFASGLPFVQTLNLPNGEILITAGSPGDEVNLRVWSDANHPAIYVEAEGASLRDWQADVELWRTSPRTLTGGELESAYGARWGHLAVPPEPPPIVEPDTVVGGLTDKLTWYHRNVHSIYPATLSKQALYQVNPAPPDPILNRTFGATLSAPGFSNPTSTRLTSDTSRADALFTIVAHTQVTPTVAAWQSALDAKAIAVEVTPIADRYTAHTDWWQAFWKRHWMVVTDTGGGITPGSDPYAVTQGYLLQRFMQACSGRGAMPIKFNGSMFTVDATSAYDADYRRWGPCYWWQNTRLPYWTMPMSGDLDLMDPLFKMYMDALPLARERVQSYYGHAGAYFPEVMYFWGTWNNDNYGWDRSGKPDGLADNLTVRWEWQAGIELLTMMLARYHADLDPAFATNTLVPMAQDIIDLYDLRYPRDPDGTIRFTPASALETYAEGTENPTPEIAGLNQVLSGLLALPAGLTTAAQTSQWSRLLGELPPLPLRQKSGNTAISPAEILGPVRNAESPELYPVFPYGQYHVGKPDLSLADWTYQTRTYPQANGWGQDVIFAAMLGRTTEAKGEVVRRFKAKHSGSRFPAIWGPNFDWMPDQDHGGVNMIALQKMVLQEDGDRILLFPAWPAGWDLTFRFYARGGTRVEGELSNGQLTDFNIFPSNRYDDVETFVGTLPPPLTGWEYWRRNTTGTDGQYDSDGDADHFVDFMEYALDGNPADPATPQGLVATADLTSDRVVLSYRRPIRRPEVIYSVEQTQVLEPADWQPLATAPTITDNGDGTETVSYPIPSPAFASTFYRLATSLQS